MTSNNGRYSESPARTIDSHDSTTGSMDTIVDCNIQHRHQEVMQNTIIAQSTNTTNFQQKHNNLIQTERVAILQPFHLSIENDDNELLLQHNKQQQEISPRQQENKELILLNHTDTQSHIYSSPVYDQKKPNEEQQSIGKYQTSKKLLSNIIHKKDNDDLIKPKLITHEEFKKQLEASMKIRSDKLEEKIYKKQRLPPEFIKDDNHSPCGLSSKSMKKEIAQVVDNESDCCTTFPIQVVLGLLQLFLAITMVALGSLLIVREVSFSTTGCGIWSGLIAAITGALGVVGIRKTQTSFLILSLISIATSTLALAISSIGLSRDINRSNQKFNLLNANAEVSAATGLIFALFLHFGVSVISVYRCAVQMCVR